MEVLEAKSAIAELVYTYALNVRRGNGVACADLFTEDGIFEVREAPLAGKGEPLVRSRLVGRDAVAAYLGRAAASSDTRVCPVIHNLLIRVDGTEATSNCAMTAFIMPDGQQMIGEYNDSYRYDGAWRFSARIHTILGEIVPSGAQPRVMTGNGR